MKDPYVITVETLLVNLYFIYMDFLILSIRSPRHPGFNPTCVNMVSKLLLSNILIHTPLPSEL